MATAKQVTQGNEFKSKTHTVTLPNGQRLTRTVNLAKQSVFSVGEFSKITTALGKAYNSSAVEHLKLKGITVLVQGSNYKFAPNHANKALCLIWEKVPATGTYAVKKGFESAVKTVLGVRTLKTEYTLTELKRFSDGGILDQMFTKVAAKPKLQLPRINRYSGEIKGKNLVYGCASLPLDWFRTPNGGSRTIKSMVLSSGVSITAANMNAIEAYMKENKI